MSTPFYDLASLVLVPSGYKAQKVYAQKPLTTDGQLTFSRASTATRVNSAGLIETVSSNVPRLDYLGSTCPKLQLEPQRSNLMLHNSAFDNAAWIKEGGSFTANAVTSPDGTTNADTFTENTSTSTHYFYNSGGFSASAAAHTGSIFAKAGTRTRLIMGIYDGTAANYQMVQFDLSAGTIVQQASAGIAKIENYGNGWYRCSVTRTLTASTCYLSFGPHTNTNLSDLTVFPSYLGASGTLHFYGAQLEVGSYSTSLINTTTAAVTRLADVASKTGISSLIGQTEGTLFVEFFYNEQNNTPSGSDKSVCRLKTGAAYADEICITYYGDEGGSYGKTIQAFIVVGGASQAVLKTTQTMVSGYYKVAVGYKANDFAMAVNGVIVATDNSGSVPTCADFTMNESTRIESNSNPKQALLFKTRLTNAQLAELTAL